MDMRCHGVAQSATAASRGVVGVAMRAANGFIPLPGVPP